MELKLSAPKIWLYSEAVDFRKSINGLVCVVQMQLEVKPTEGIFIFCNRGKDKVKILMWHGNGFMMVYKRLEQGKFTVVSRDSQSTMIDERELSWLLSGLNWDKMRHWNELSYKDFY